MTDSPNPRAYPTTVVFDLDGLIFNTEEIFLEATNQLLAPLGKKQTPDVVAQIMGQPSDVSTQILKDYHSLSDSVSEIRSQLDRHFDLVLDSILAFMPGFEELLQRLIQENIPRAICTSSSAAYADDTYCVEKQETGHIYLWAYVWMYVYIYLYIYREIHIYTSFLRM